MLAAFEPWRNELDESSDHVLPVEPADPGNLGTVLRTMAGLGVHDLAVVPPVVDPWDPRVVRASMGARFAVRVATTEDPMAYAARFRTRTLYPLVTDGAHLLDEVRFASPATLVFGPESAGLDRAGHTLGPTVTIPQSPDIDSSTSRSPHPWPCGSCGARSGGLPDPPSGPRLGLARLGLSRLRLAGRRRRLSRRPARGRLVRAHPVRADRVRGRG